MRHLIPLGTLVALSACISDRPVLLEDTRYATGSRTMVADAQGEHLFALNIDEGSVTRVNVSNEALDTIDLGAEPTRIARAGDLYFVTLRAERAVAVFRNSSTGMQREDTIDVGCEPFGVVATEDGSRVFVTLSQEARTIGIDVRTREITDSWHTPGDPRWMALHPNGERLYVGAARGGVVYSIDTDNPGPEAVEVIEMPIAERTTDSDGRVELAVRLMGDPAVDPTGSRLVFPALYVDNKSERTLPPRVDPTTLYYYTPPAPQPEIGRFNSVLIEIPLRPDGDPKENKAEPIFIAGMRSNGISAIRSYPNAVTISPDGLYYTVSVEGSDAVLMVGALNFDRGTKGNFEFVDEGVAPLLHGFSYRPVVAQDFRREHGPRSVVYLDEKESRVHNFLNRSVTRLKGERLQGWVRELGITGGSTDNATRSDDYGTVLTPSALTFDQRSGRALFYTSINTDLAANGGGVSCNTCHMDGRDDGLTWQLGPDVWQTPSLAGKVSDTHPVTWDKQIESAAAEAAETSRIRMGGEGLTQTQLDWLGAYVDFTREVDTPTRDLQTPAVLRGQVLFEREDVACASCHHGVAYTDNDHHDLYGLVAVNTPPLRGIAATGPYLHDGRAATIRDVLELSRAKVMGDTSMLSAAELSDLEAYVLSL